jgi:hypothetical protein
MTMLFSGAELKVAFKNVQGNAETEIANYSDDYVLAHAIEDLTESVYGKYAVQAPVLDKNAESDWVDGYVPEHLTPNPNFDQQPLIDRQTRRQRRRRSEHAEDQISDQAPRGHLQREPLVRSLLRHLSECVESGR